MRSWALFGVVVLALVVALGLLSSPKPDPIASDRLGPEAGESTGAYAARAAATLTEGADDPRWALVSLDAPVTVDEAITLAGDDVRISQVLFRAPGPESMLVFVAVPANANAIRRAPGLAARTDPAISPDCACVTALLVRADLSTLRHLATRAGVTAVEALPADAVYGRFGLTPVSG